MIYKAKEFILKDGSKAIFKTPEVSDAKQLLNNIITTANSTDYLLTSEEDFAKYVEDISFEENFIRNNRESNNWLIAAYIDEYLVGSCSLDLHFHKKDKHRATIGIAIQKPYWDKGIGSIFFDEMIKIAKTLEGIEQIELDVAANNERAKHLYTKKGFVKTGDIPHQLKLDDGTYIDGELMVLFLNK